MKILHLPNERMAQHRWYITPPAEPNFNRALFFFCVCRDDQNSLTVKHSKQYLKPFMHEYFNGIFFVISLTERRWSFKFDSKTFRFHQNVYVFDVYL